MVTCTHFTADIRLHFPFFYHPPVTTNGDSTRGSHSQLELITTEQLFQRVQRTYPNKYRLSTVNSTFSVCNTYDRAVVVPASVTDDVLKCSAQFRALHRFPVLCYFHESTRVFIGRSGQPLCGGGSTVSLTKASTSQKRSREDETLLSEFLKSAGGHRGCIVDLRSQSAAEASMTTKGGGYEQEVYYPRWKRVHLAVGRWTQLKEALSKMVDACTEVGGDKFTGRLAQSNWLQCVHDVMLAANSVAQFVGESGFISQCCL